MSGDDDVAPDGSPVDLYDRWLPALGEAELVDDIAGAGASVLELGSGAGRVTRQLLALGHPVVAIDESPAMLKRIAGTPGVEMRCAAIGALELGRTFDVVLLGSNLVNVADDERRHEFLRTCRRHLAHEGHVLIERMDPRWSDPVWAHDKAAHPGRLGDVVVTSHALHVDPPYLSQITEFAVPGGRTWRQGPYTLLILDDDAMERDLLRAGLQLGHWLPWQGTDRIWCSAHAAEGSQEP